MRPPSDSFLIRLELRERNRTCCSSLEEGIGRYIVFKVLGQHVTSEET